MFDGLQEIYAVLGLGVISFIGSAALKDAGKPSLATVLDIITTVSGAVIAMKAFKEGAEYVENVFHVW